MGSVLRLCLFEEPTEKLRTEFQKYSMVQSGARAEVAKYKCSPGMAIEAIQSESDHCY